MNWREAIEAANSAKITLHNADSLISDLLPVIVGRLKNTHSTYRTREALSKLKKELKDFNSVTKTWKHER